ncbi:MAG: TetR/AcrR family transcriptional regulator [Candidatus Sifarchaeia archaeon]
MSLVESRGYLETTNKMIAQHANVSVGLVYKYFPRGKVDILRQLILDSQAVFESTEEELSPRIPVPKSDPSHSPKSLHDFIYQMLEFIIDGHMRNARFIRALEIAMLAEPSSFEDLVNWTQQVLNLAPIINELQKHEIVKKPLNEKEMIINTNIIDLIVHRYIFYPGNPFSSHQDFLEYLVDLFIQLFGVEVS